MSGPTKKIQAPEPMGKSLALPIFFVMKPALSPFDTWKTVLNKLERAGWTKIGDGPDAKFVFPGSEAEALGDDYLMEEDLKQYCRANFWWDVPQPPKSKGLVVEIEKESPDEDKIKRRLAKCKTPEEVHDEDAAGRSSIHVAAGGGTDAHLRIFKALWERLMVFAKQYKAGFVQGGALKSLDSAGWTPLMYAASVGHVDTVELILDHIHQNNIEVSAEDIDKEYVLDPAVQDAIIRRVLGGDRAGFLSPLTDNSSSGGVAAPTESIQRPPNQEGSRKRSASAEEKSGEDKEGPKKAKASYSCVLPYCKESSEGGGKDLNMCPMHYKWISSYLPIACEMKELNAKRSVYIQQVNAANVAADRADKEKKSLQRELADTQAAAKEAKKEAEKELAAAKAAPKEAKKKAEKELAAAKAASKEANKELADTKKELTDTKKELADTKKELADSNKVIDDAKKELADTKKELADAKKELADAKAHAAAAQATASAAKEAKSKVEEMLDTNSDSQAKLEKAVLGITLILSFKNDEDKDKDALKTLLENITSTGAE